MEKGTTIRTRSFSSWAVHLKGFSPIGLFPFIMSFAQLFLSMQLFFTKQIVWPSNSPFKSQHKHSYHYKHIDMFY
jgi:hypothetical protein